MSLKIIFCFFTELKTQDGGESKKVEQGNLFLSTIKRQRLAAIIDNIFFVPTFEILMAKKNTLSTIKHYVLPRSLIFLTLVVFVFKFVVVLQPANNVTTSISHTYTHVTKVKFQVFPPLSSGPGDLQHLSPTNLEKNHHLKPHLWCVITQKILPQKSSHDSRH